MKKLAFALGALAMLSGALAVPTSASEESTVNATVTPMVISVSVSPSSVAYGVQAVGTSDAVPDPAYFTVTNNGSVAENFQIKGANTANWTLASTPGANQYVHKYSTGAGGSFLALTTTAAPLLTSVAPAGNAQIYLKMDLPTSSTTFAQQSAAVTIVAVQAP